LIAAAGRHAKAGVRQIVNFAVTTMQKWNGWDAADEGAGESCANVHRAIDNRRASP